MLAIYLFSKPRTNAGSKKYRSSLMFKYTTRLRYCFDFVNTAAVIFVLMTQKTRYVTVL